MQPMKTSPVGFRTPAAGFDDPVELWLACHERVRRFCRMLERLPLHLAAHGADAAAQEAARSIRRYFNEAAPRHHADEEEDLFPRLIAQAAPAQAQALQATLAALETEHAANEERWRALDAALAAVERGVAAAPDAPTLADFVRIYAAHIATEESIVLDALRASFTGEDWRAVGAAMARRRGARWQP